MTGAVALKDLAQVIRSKNAGPFEITLDVMFTDPAVYVRVRDSGVLTRERLAGLYKVADSAITYCDFFEPALAFKCTIIRGGDQGGVGERDTFGAQQHAPLLDLMVPEHRSPTMTVTDHTTSATTATLSESIAQAVTRISYDDIPDRVLAVARAHALDAIGIALASTGMDYGHAVHVAGSRLATGGAARVLGFATPLPAADAALVDGTLMHGLDFDDTHIGAIYHATGPALAAALTVGEEVHASGRDVLAAYILGMEVGCRLAAAGAGRFHLRGFHPTGIAGTFAAACVTAKLRGLSAEALTSALGLCGSQAAGILELHGSWLKRMHPGWAAHSGIIAATLAEAGFRGPARVFEGPAGLYQSHLGETVSADDLGVEDLGTRWMTADIALKPYPCCHFTHAFVDASRAALAQLDRTHLRADEVASIVCPTAPALQAMVTQPAEVKEAPKTIYDALFSVQYVVATTLAGRPVDLAAFYDSPLDDPEILALAAKVTCPADPDTDFPAHFPGEVTVELSDGSTASCKVRDSHGTPQDPMTDDEVLAKFHATAGRRVDRAQSDRVARLVTRLDDLADIVELIDACAVTSAGPAQVSD